MCYHIADHHDSCLLILLLMQPEKYAYLSGKACLSTLRNTGSNEIWGRYSKTVEKGESTQVDPVTFYDGSLKYHGPRDGWICPLGSRGVDGKPVWMYFQWIHTSSSAHLNSLGAYHTGQEALNKLGGVIQRRRGILESRWDAFISSGVLMLLMLHLFAVLSIRPRESIFSEKNTKIQFKVWSLPLFGLSHSA